MDSFCANVAANSATTIGNSNIATVQQSQSNTCLKESGCTNIGEAAAILTDDNTNIELSMSQKNLCIDKSTCNNIAGLLVSGTSGSNSQSNVCLKNSDCTNNGTNNKSICVSGSSL